MKVRISEHKSKDKRISVARPFDIHQTSAHSLRFRASTSIYLYAHSQAVLSF